MARPQEVSQSIPIFKLKVTEQSNTVNPFMPVTEGEAESEPGTAASAVCSTNTFPP